jgi:hypothetical protein
MDGKAAAEPPADAGVAEDSQLFKTKVKLTKEEKKAKQAAAKAARLAKKAAKETEADGGGGE